MCTQMYAVVTELGRFATWDEVEACDLHLVIAGWIRRAAASSSPLVGAASAAEPAASEPVWSAFKTVLQLLAAPVVVALSREHPSLLPLVLEAAGLSLVPPGDTLRSSALPVPLLAPPSSVRNALACLRVIATCLGRELWSAPQASASPEHGSFASMIAGSSRTERPTAGEFVDMLAGAGASVGRPDVAMELLRAAEAVLQALLSHRQQQPEAYRLMYAMYNQVRLIPPGTAAACSLSLSPSLSLSHLCLSLSLSLCLCLVLNPLPLITQVHRRIGLPDGVRAMAAVTSLRSAFLDH